jgi:hypothetical protein
MPERSILPGKGQVIALSDRGRGPGAALRPWSGSIFESTPGLRLTTEQRLIRAYLTLFVVPPHDNGSKIVPLARFGSFEVRLCEPAPDAALDTFPLWIEIYAHDRRVTLDSCGCDELEAAVTAADAFMAHAKALHEEATHAPVRPRRELARGIVTTLREAGFVCNLIDED